VEDTAITHFVQKLSHPPERISGSLYRKPGTQGAFQWLTISFKLTNTKLNKVGPWLLGLRTELEEHGVSVRDIESNIHFLNIEPEKNPICNCHADFKVIATEAFQESFDTFKAAAQSLLNRDKKSP
jgi:hypothetical protein